MPFYIGGGDLAVFLRARLDDHEQLARLVLASTSQGPAFEIDPEWVLRDVEAKRAILAEYARLDADPARLTDTAMHLCWTVLGNVVRAFAAVDSDHPGYRPEWGV